MLLEQTYSLCNALVPQDCVDKYGNFGCENYLLSLLYKMSSQPPSSQPPGGEAVYVPTPDASGGRDASRGKFVALVSGTTLGSALTVALIIFAVFLFTQRRCHLLSVKFIPKVQPAGATTCSGTGVSMISDNVGENNSGCLTTALPLDDDAYPDTTKHVLIELGVREPIMDMATTAMASCSNNPRDICSMEAATAGVKETVGDGGGSATTIPATGSGGQCSKSSCTPVASAGETVITPYTPTRADLVLGVQVRLAAPHLDLDQACNATTSLGINMRLRSVDRSPQAARHAIAECEGYTVKVQSFEVQQQQQQQQQLYAAGTSSRTGLSSHDGGNVKSEEQRKVGQRIVSGARDSGQTADEDEMVTLLPVLRGKGSFGRVYEGRWQGQAVAVKLLLLEELAAIGISGPGHTTHLPQQTNSLQQDSTWRNSGSWQLAFSSWLDGTEEKEHEHEDVEDKKERLTREGESVKQLGVAGPWCGGSMFGSADNPAAGEALLSIIQPDPQRQAKEADTAIPNRNVAHMLASLQQEVQVLGRCCHVNVVRLLAACLTPPRVCLVMELMDTSLDTLLYGQKGYHENRQARVICSDGGPSTSQQQLLPLAKVLHISTQIAAALEYLHPTIVHRDLKPANVLLNDPHSDFPVVKLTDFGLSRIGMGTLATLHLEAGTPTYLAPECYDSRKNIIMHQSDLYSLGVLIWAMLSGRRPWQGCSIPAVAYKVAVLGERPPLEQISSRRCPLRLRQLVKQCWDPDPLRRPAAAEMAKELSEMLAAQLARGHRSDLIDDHTCTLLPAGGSIACPTSDMALPPAALAGLIAPRSSSTASSLPSNNAVELEGLELEISDVK
ncbi:hypothetical protein Vretimale_18576 [Volvox reticuliferus]|nr:hypothetical protein Vretifemale_17034 [Volvox reticuliferus]GIM15921.1 hypothetical protein Vretimale_18576 [Volvox reticuliferus]